MNTVALTRLPAQIPWLRLRSPASQAHARQVPQRSVAAVKVVATEAVATECDGN